MLTATLTRARRSYSQMVADRRRLIEQIQERATEVLDAPEIVGGSFPTETYWWSYAGTMEACEAMRRLRRSLLSMWNANTAIYQVRRDGCEVLLTVRFLP